MTGRSAIVPAGLSEIGEWSSRARCIGADPETLFVDGSAQIEAKKICLGCPVQLECLAAALDNRIEFGIWGGMTERERRTLRRHSPGVRSWRTLLERAQTERVESA